MWWGFCEFPAFCLRALGCGVRTSLTFFFTYSEIAYDEFQAQNWKDEANWKWREKFSDSSWSCAHLKIASLWPLLHQETRQLYLSEVSQSVFSWSTYGEKESPTGIRFPCWLQISPSRACASYLPSTSDYQNGHLARANRVVLSSSTKCCKYTIQRMARPFMRSRWRA